MAKKNVILCGFMGCGKSTIGSLLAKKIGSAFIDLDRYIEKQEKKSVSQIFADNGEPYFRDLERKAAQTLSHKNGLVIAAGGGTLTFPANVDGFRHNGCIVLLNIPVEIAAQRLQYDTTRPLLNRPDKEEVMRDLYNQRLPLYQSAADITVDASQSPMQVCLDIISSL